MEKPNIEISFYDLESDEAIKCNISFNEKNSQILKDPVRLARLILGVGKLFKDKGYSERSDIRVKHI